MVQVGSVVVSETGAEDVESVDDVVSGEEIIVGAGSGKTAGEEDIADIADVLISVGGGESNEGVGGTGVDVAVLSACCFVVGASPPITARPIIDLALAFCIHIGFLIHLREPSTSVCGVDLLELGLPLNVRE